MSIQKIIENTLMNSGNEKYIAKNINQYLGNICDKCDKQSEQPLTIVMSFDKSKGSYRFTDLPGANYKLKKFCKGCCYSRASPAPIYIEIQDKNLIGNY